MPRLSFGTHDVDLDEPRDAVSADAQICDRFHQINACRIEFPRVQFVHGRGRVLFLSAVGHEVVLHGSEGSKSTHAASTGESR